MEIKSTPVPLNKSKLAPERPAADPQEAPAKSAEASEPVSAEELKEKVIDALRTCYDPEIPVNIYELGLVYSVDVTPERAVGIRMTLTSPACPVAGSLPGEVQSRVQAVPGVTAAKVDLVWDPPWDKSMMSEMAMIELGMY